MYWRGNNKRKSQWSMRWLGPGIVIGHEGRANVWISHRNAVVKAAGNHVRLAEVQEQLPWHDLYDSLRETDEQTYFDLSPPGVSRDPQYGGPSTSSGVPMTPVPVPDEPTLDVIADEPDTSEIPVLPNSGYAPVRNPRVRWRSDVLEHPTPQTASPPAVSSQNVPAATPSWSPPLPVTRETPSIQQPVAPHVDVQPEFQPPASTADDDPMPFPHVDDTPPWVYQEPETPWIPIDQETPATIPQQVPLPPIQVSPSREETNVSTGDSIIPPPPWFDETPQPSSTIHEDVSPPVPSFDETPFVTAPVPETPTIPSVAKRCRSGALHLENPVSKRWRSDALHPETLVPTTKSPQLRWRAGVLRALRPFRRLRDTQSDPLERVKRSRLAPAQVMSTALAKHCDWSLGFDERGPVFDGTQDSRHSVFLTGRAARKEVYFASESPENQRLLLAAMESEWKKWEEHKATLPLTQGELCMLKSRRNLISRRDLWYRAARRILQ